MRDMISDGVAAVEPLGVPNGTHKLCPKCQTEFTPKRSNQTYCTDACRKNGTRGSRKAEDWRANEEHQARAHDLFHMIYSAPVSERLGVMQHILSHVPIDAGLRRILTDPKLLREPPRGDGRKNIAKAANAYTKKFFGVSIKTFIAQSREGTLNEAHPVTREMDHGAVLRLKPMRRVKCWHHPVMAKDRAEADRDAERSELARAMTDAAVKHAQAMVHAHLIEAAANF